MTNISKRTVDRIKAIALSAIALSLTSCAAPIARVSTPRSVIIGNSNAGNSVESLQLAERECQKYGRHAVHIPDNIRDGNATYECKD